MALMASMVIGSSTSWTCADALAGEGAQRVGERRRVAVDGRDGGLRGRCPGAGPSRRAGGRAPRPSARPRPGRARPRGRPRRRGRAAGRRPSGRLSVSLYQAFQESTWGMVIRSIRGPIEPIISGGPAGRGPRGRSSQSRAWYQRPSKSMAPSRRSVRMIVNASSKRSIRWSYGKPKARNSVSFQPAPRPRTNRPPLISSIVAACLASRAGLWKLVQATSGPSSILVVAAAMADEQRPGLPRPARRPVRPAIEQVLADPDRIEPEILDRADHVEELGPAHLALDLGQLDADPERAAGGRGSHGPSVAAGIDNRPALRRPCPRHDDPPPHHASEPRARPGHSTLTRAPNGAERPARVTPRHTPRASFHAQRSDKETSWTPRSRFAASSSASRSPQRSARSACSSSAGRWPRAACTAWSPGSAWRRPTPRMARSPRSASAPSRMSSSTRARCSASSVASSCCGWPGRPSARRRPRPRPSPRGAAATPGRTCRSWA